jgi:cytochrome c-type biogenesis protein CcsB
MFAEVILMWTAVSLYALGTILYVVGLVFQKERVAGAALWVSLAGLIPQGVALGVRWARVGHPPYLGYYEALSTFAFLSVLVLGLMTWRYRSLSAAGIFVMPMSFLLLGLGMLMPSRAIQITPRLASFWLDIHVIFANLTFAFLAASFVLALIYLTRDYSPSGRWAEIFGRLPAQDVVEDLSYKFVAAGSIFIAIMTASGAIWANEAWGRYWGWDPIETWSLISFLVYSVVLHLRLTWGWKGRRWAWLTVGALPFVAFTLLGLPLVYNSIHNGEMLGPR